jgi:hypothetical protein
MTYVGSGYAEHLTDADLELLTAVSGIGSGVAGLRREPAAIPELLDHPRVFEALYGRPGIASGRPEAVSPFLAFAVAVHRAAAELTSMNYLPERCGQRQRVPVFDAPQLSAAGEVGSGNLSAITSENVPASSGIPARRP